MPTVPSATKCSTLGCKNPKARFSSLCIEHGGRDKFDYKRYNNTQDRKEAADMYSTKQWRTLRQIQLSQYPLCAGCKASGIITSATHVDHIFPWRQIGGQSFTYNLFQSLCNECHTSKTHLEQQGIFRAYGVRDYTKIDYSIAVANQ